MRKLGLFVSALLLLSGCSFTSTYTINGDGTITGTSTFGVPKSALPKVKTVAQWKAILDSNNFPAPTLSPEPTDSASPTPSASCLADEDLVLGQWIYSCDVSGDVSALNSATSASGSSDMSYSRVGQTLTITQAASSGSSDSENPIGLTGVTLFFVTTTLTLPGTVTEVTGSATKVNDNTVKFETDESQTDPSTATITLPTVTTTETSLTLTAKVTSSTPDNNEVSLEASLADPALGVIEFFDGETSLGKQEVTLEGTAQLATPAQDGSHNYSAKFLPTNWWGVDQATANKSLTIATFRVTTNPKVTGSAKVGAKLAIGSLRSSPTATKISYQWLRNGKAIAGATKSTYTVGASDYKKYLAVRMVLTKKDYQPMTVVTNGVLISKR